MARQRRMRAKSASGTTLDIPPAERHMGRSLQSPVHNPVTVAFSTHETSAIADLRNTPAPLQATKLSAAGVCFLHSPHSVTHHTHLPDTHCVQTPAAESSGRWERFGEGGTPSERGFLPLQGLPQISKFSAKRALFSMNWRRGSTLSPMSRENISSQAMASSMVTRRMVR